MSKFRILWGHKGVRYITLGWTGFITENLVMSHNREYIIDYLNEYNYHLIYNTLSTAAMISVVYGYIRYRNYNSITMNNIFNSWNINSRSFKITSLSMQSLGLIGISQIFPKIQNPFVFNMDISSDNTNNTSIESDIKPKSKYKYIYLLNVPLTLVIQRICPIMVFMD